MNSINARRKWWFKMIIEKICVTTCNIGHITPTKITSVKIILLNQGRNKYL